MKARASAACVGMARILRLARPLACTTILGAACLLPLLMLLGGVVASAIFDPEIVHANFLLAVSAWVRAMITTPSCQLWPAA